MAEPSTQFPALVLELMEDTVAVGPLDSSRGLPGRQLSSFPTVLVSLNRCFPDYSPSIGKPCRFGSRLGGQDQATSQGPFFLTPF